MRDVGCSKSYRLLVMDSGHGWPKTRSRQLFVFVCEVRAGALQTCCRAIMKPPKAASQFSAEEVLRGGDGGLMGGVDGGVDGGVEGG